MHLEMKGIESQFQSKKIAKQNFTTSNEQESFALHKSFNIHLNNFCVISIFFVCRLECECVWRCDTWPAEMGKKRYIKRSFWQECNTQKWHALSRTPFGLYVCNRCHCIYTASRDREWKQTAAMTASTCTLYGSKIFLSLTLSDCKNTPNTRFFSWQGMCVECMRMRQSTPMWMCVVFNCV